MDRLDGGSDRRLHGRASFGVGGHIGATDGGILGALHREWQEEVATPILPHFTPLGLLNDDGDEVGAAGERWNLGDDFGGGETGDRSGGLSHRDVWRGRAEVLAGDRQRGADNLQRINLHVSVHLR